MAQKLRKAKVRSAKKSKNPFVLSLLKAQAKAFDSVEKNIWFNKK